MKIRTIILVLVLLSFFTVSAGGYLYYSSMKESAVNEVSRDTDNLIKTLAERIDLNLLNYQKMTKGFAVAEELQNALLHRSPGSLAKANAVLDYFQDGFHADVCYLMDVDGNTIASSNRDSPDSFIGENYAFRPYFRQSVGGFPAVYMAVGVTSKKQGVYYSQPVYRAGQKSPIGVVVMKTSVEYLQEEISRYFDGVALLSDPSGVIFVSNRGDLPGHLLWKASPEVLSVIEKNQQFGKGPFDWSGFERKNQDRLVDEKGNEYFVYEAGIDKCPGWKVLFLRDIKKITDKISGQMLRSFGYFMLVFSVLFCFALGYLYTMANKEILARKRADEMLREERDKAQKYLDIAGVMLTVLNSSGVVTLINRKGSEILGCNEEEITGKNWFDNFLPARMKDEIHAAFRRQMSGETGFVEYFECPVLSKNNEEKIISFHNTLLRDKEGAIAGLLFSGQDITERRLIYDELRKSEERYRNLFESSLDGIYHTDADGIFRMMNQAGAKIFGHETPLEIIGTPALRYWRDPKDREAFTEELKIRKKVSGYHISARKITGEKIEIESTSRIIEDEHNNFLGIEGILRDVTRRMRMEEELLISRKFESIGILGKGIAHDFNNLLNAILGNISFAKVYVKPEDRIFDMLEESEKASLKAVELVSRLAQLSDIDEPLKKTLAVSELIKDSLCLSVSGRNLRCKYVLSDDLWEIEADEIQIRQVFEGMLSNAFEAMPEGGAVEITAENITIGPEEVIPLKKGEYVRLSVRDYGPGIPKDILSKIFDPYFTTKKTWHQRGLGLGLAACYAIIKNHKGLITVESDVGVGSTFNVYLPAHFSKQ